ncbi:hypothetical protein M3697_02640 [Janibacter melonis]|uniref:hypothetical protein n=1 Tax=Janibacter melonis TaxID=262209 RepID=UPI0020442E17|nr:hypothetical protein [Janibacter melonis]MCM3554013.1 hypothetical protein [Janibacter melonis]
MSEHSMDETMNDVTRSARLAMMLMAQASEQLARRIAEIQRAAAHESNERAFALREQISAAQDAARRAYQPLTDPARFAHADAETAAAAWATAAAWADVDLQAAAAQASLREQIVQRWEVDPEGLRDATTNTTPQPDRLAEAMDPQWRESATTQDLEQRWSDVQSDKDRPGAAEALAVLDAELHERFGLDVEKLRRSEHDITETLWNAAGDHAAAEADRAAETSEQTTAAGWENEAHTERNQEATAGDDVGQEVEDSVDAREAEGQESAGSAAAATEHDQARADAAAMERAGVPARSQQVRLSTARGFGASTKEGAKQPGRAKGRKTPQRRSADHVQDRGR